MFTTIVLAVILVVFLGLFVKSQSNTNTKDAVAVINLKRRLRIDILLFALFLGYALYQGLVHKAYDQTTITLTFALILVILYTTYVAPNNLVFKKDTIHFNIVKLGYAYISDVRIDGPTKVTFGLNGTTRRLTFETRSIEQTSLVLQTCADLKLFGVDQLLDTQKLTVTASKIGGIFPMLGKIMAYDWGGKNFIAKLLQKKPTGQPMAEYWLGTHSTAPATIEISGDILATLNDNQTDENKVSTIDRKTNYQLPLVSYLLHADSIYDKHDDDKRINLPYLFKILDVARPLSIQLHPDLETAQQGFEAENKKKIALNNPTRNFKDPNHKPELMVALSDFYLLHGLNTKDNILTLLNSRPSLNFLKETLTDNDVGQVYKDLMTMSKSDFSLLFKDHVKECLVKYASFVKQQLQQKDINQTFTKGDINSDIAALDPDYWTAFCYLTMNMTDEDLDPGLSAFYLFNLLKLEKGEGIFQKANIPHAYLRGQNFEVMAESDNVIRGGLTTKHIDTELLCKLVDTNAVVPEILTGPEYPVPVKDFAVSVKDIDNSEINIENASILFVLEGTGSIKLSEKVLGLIDFGSFTLEPGKSFFVTRNQKLQVSGKVKVAIATAKELV